MENSKEIDYEKILETLAEIVRINTPCYMPHYVLNSPAHEDGVQKIVKAIISPKCLKLLAPLFEVDRKKLLGKVLPVHLNSWANDFEKDCGYKEPQLAHTLRYIAKALTQTEDIVKPKENKID